MGILQPSAFTRQTMLPAEKPPLREAGAVKWLRANLFSSPLNSLLTVFGLIFILWLLQMALPWLWHSVWNANSRAECREIHAAMGAHSGACWGVIKARWHQYIFGFYPSDQYWRPTLTAGLLIAGLAPILFWRDRKSVVMAAVGGAVTVLALLLLGAPLLVVLSTIVIFGTLCGFAWAKPSLLILCTCLFPFLAIWLIWGGPVWGMMNTLLAVVIAALAARLYAAKKRGWLSDIFALIVAIAAAAVAATIISYADAISGDFLRRLNRITFWQPLLQDNGLIAGVFGWLLSSVGWLIMGLILVLLSIMRLASFVLNLGLDIVFPNNAWAGFFNLGAVATFAGVFMAARRKSPVIGVLGGVLAGGIWLQLIAPSLTAGLFAVLPWGIQAISSDQIGGFLLALIIGVSAIAASLPLGILLALGRRSDMFLMRVLSIGFIEFIRGVPLITLLFTASLLLQYFLPPQSNFDLILRVIILASLFAAAYLAEVVRGGLAALPRGQYEAGDSLGLTFWQAQRLIIMPQALKISIPGIVSTFIGLFKDTTLVSFVGLLDPLRGVTMAVRADMNWKGIYWEPYIFVAAIFFVICFSMSRYSMYLEQKLKTDHR